jgi:hypothetical protein
MDRYIATSIFITNIIGIISFIVFYNWKWIKTKYNKCKTVYTLINSDNFTTGSEFQLHPNGKSAIITYNRYGKNYHLYVPYSGMIATEMNRFRAYLIKDSSDKKGKKEEEITQQPGIPYMITASDLGGEKIIFRYRDRREVEFSSEIIPKII